MTFQQQITEVFKAVFFDSKLFWKRLTEQAAKMVAEARKQWNSCCSRTHCFDQSEPFEGYVYLLLAYKNGVPYFLSQDCFTAFYIGATKSLLARIAEHLSGFGSVSTENATKQGYEMRLVATIHTDDIYRLESLLKQANESNWQWINGERTIAQVISAAENLNSASTKSRVQLRAIKRVKETIMKKLVPWYKG